MGVWLITYIICDFIAKNVRQPVSKAACTLRAVDWILIIGLSPVCYSLARLDTNRRSFSRKHVQSASCATHNVNINCACVISCLLAARTE